MRRTRYASRGVELSRKDFLRLGGTGLVGAVLLGGGALAGCGGGDGEAGGATKLIFSWGPDDAGTVQQLVKEFNDQHEGEIQVEYREMPADTGQYFDRLRTEFQAGASEIDVIGGDVIWPAQFAAQGWILDISDRFPEGERNQFLDAPIEALTYEGRIYGIPWHSDAGMLYYRQDLLEESGFSEPPQSWEELKEMADKVRQDSDVPRGFLFQGAEYEGGVCNALEYIWTHGGDVLDGERVIIDSPESIAGLETYRSMMADDVAPQAVANYKEQETQQIFLNGEAIFCRYWPSLYAAIGDPEESRIEEGQVGVAPLPVSQGGESVSTLGGWTMLINAATNKQDEAWEFVQFMTNRENLKMRAIEGGYLPPRTELYDDQEVLEEVPIAELGREALENTRPRPVSPYYSDLSLEMARHFNRSLKGDTSPEEAIKTLQRELSSIVEEGQQTE
jgi:multiple sugar transport system substrate-binding protein